MPRGATVVKEPTKSLRDLLGTRSLPDGALDFLASLLQLDPKNRLSAAASLSHPFLRPLRDADMKERKSRQLEEKRKQQRDLTMDCDDGIEEEIPGEESSSKPTLRAEAKCDAKPAAAANSRSYKDGPRTFDFKNLDSAISGSDAKSKGHHQAEGSERHAAIGAGNNSAECDGDDIQEIIEMDEHGAPGTQQRLSPGAKQNRGDIPSGFQATPSPPHSKNTRRRHSLDGKHVDPLEQHECYEDDFEDYHS